MKQNLEPIRSKIYEIRGHKEEWDSLRFQIGIIEVGRGQYTKFLPHAFTEQGLATGIKGTESKGQDGIKNLSL